MKIHSTAIVDASRRYRGFDPLRRVFQNAEKAKLVIELRIIFVAKGGDFKKMLTGVMCKLQHWDFQATEW